MSTVRQTIITEALAKAATITTGNGYSQTVATVSEWRTTPFVETECPAIDIRDTMDDLSEDGNNNSHRCIIEIRGIATGSSVMAAVRNLAGDIVTAFDNWQPTNTSGSQYIQAEFDRDLEKNNFGMVTVTIEVFYPVAYWRL